MEFEWKIFPGHTRLQIFSEIHRIYANFGLRTRILPRTSYLDVDVERHRLATYRQRAGMVGKRTNCWHLCKKVCAICHSSDQVQKRSGLQPTLLTLEENGTELQNS